MNNQGGFINSLLFAFILIVVSSVALYFVSQKQNHLLSLINKNGQENTSPAILLNNQKNDIEKIYTTTNETNTISTETSKDITIQLQINGSSGNSVTLKTGENAVITWNTKNASQCFSEGKGSNAWSSQERTTIGRYVASNISLTGETQFILACKSGGKTKSLTVTLNVVSSLSKLPQPSSPQPATPSTQIVPPNNNQPKKKILEKFAPMVYDDTIYSQGAPNGYRVSRKFYETHPDVYDFIVVYSAIPVGTQSASGGIVKNGIRGNGSFYPDQDDTAKFGSNGKLLGYFELRNANRF